MPSSPFLKRIRKKIASEYKPLEKLLAEKNFKKEFPNGITGESLKRIPQGFEEDHPAAVLLKLKSFTFGSDLTKKDLMSPSLPKLLTKKIAIAQPILEFFAQA